MNIVFLVPKSDIPEGIREEVFASVLPIEYLGVGYLSACLYDRGFTSFIIDAEISGLSPNDLENDLLSRRIDLLCITCNQYQYNNVEDIVKRIVGKGFDGKIIMGGQLPTLALEELASYLPEVDWFLIGEGEVELPKLVEYMQSGDKGILDAISGLSSRKKHKSWTIPKPAIALHSLDSLSFPFHYAMAWEKKKLGRTQIVPGILSSRGCGWNSCTFCSTAAANRRIKGGGEWRTRSPEDVVAEIAEVQETYGSEHFVFVDEDVLGAGFGVRRFREIIQVLRAEGIRIQFQIPCRSSDVNYELFEELKDAGLERALIGFESISDQCLAYLNKGILSSQNFRTVQVLKRLGIDINPGLIPFHPNSTIDQVKADFHFLVEVIGYNEKHKYQKRLLPDFNTPLFYQLLREKRLKGRFPSFMYEFDDRQVQRLYNRLKEQVLSSNAFESDPIALYETVQKWGR